MSDGLSYFLNSGFNPFNPELGPYRNLNLSSSDTDSLDGRDIWDDEEITQVIKDINQPGNYRDPFAWLAPACECGSTKTYGDSCSPQMHANYCPLKREMKK